MTSDSNAAGSTSRTTTRLTSPREDRGDRWRRLDSWLAVGGGIVPVLAAVAVTAGPQLGWVAALLASLVGLSIPLAIWQRRRAHHRYRLALEDQVQDRTARLVNANASLQYEMSERKLLEDELRQAQKMEAVGRLSGGVAHDFNNMLGVITGYTELVLDTLPEDAPQRRGLLAIREAAERATALTRQLLIFSRRQLMRPEVINLNDVVRELRKMLGRLLGESVQLNTILNPDLGYVKADPGQIQQVLMNLVVNARDAMSEGGNLIIATAAVELSSEEASRYVGVAPGKYIRLVVADDGTGMNEETRSRVFEPFFTTKDAGKGTGIGLSTVHGIVMQSGGHISVESKPNEGSTFQILLPEVEPEPIHATAERLMEEAMVPGTETVLVVEDEEMLRNVLKRVLSTHGYGVLEARDGKEALQLFDADGDGIDLVLTDIVMPGMNGRELAERIRSVRPQLPVLFMSGYPDDDDVVRDVSISDEKRLLQKPFTPETLVRAVREVLNVPRSP